MSCERSRGHESASRGCKSANKGRESACIALDSATRDLEIVGETVRVFAGPLSFNRGRLREIEAMKVPLKTMSANKGCESAHSSFSLSNFFDSENIG